MKNTTAQARRLAAKADEAHALLMKALRLMQKTQDAHSAAKHIACIGLPTHAPMKEASKAYAEAHREYKAAELAAKRARQTGLTEEVKP